MGNMSNYSLNHVTKLVENCTLLQYISLIDVMQLSDVSLKLFGAIFVFPKIQFSKGYNPNGVCIIVHSNVMCEGIKDHGRILNKTL